MYASEEPNRNEEEEHVAMQEVLIDMYQTLVRIKPEVRELFSYQDHEGDPAQALTLSLMHYDPEDDADEEHELYVGINVISYDDICSKETRFGIEYYREQYRTMLDTPLCNEVIKELSDINRNALAKYCFRPMVSDLLDEVEDNEDMAYGDRLNLMQRLRDAADRAHVRLTGEHWLQEDELE